MKKWTAHVDQVIRAHRNVLEVTLMKMLSRWTKDDLVVVNDRANRPGVIMRDLIALRSGEFPGVVLYVVETTAGEREYLTRGWIPEEFTRVELSPT